VNGFIFGRGFRKEALNVKKARVIIIDETGERDYERAIIFKFYHRVDLPSIL
jgi:hypothetical protein